MSANAASSTLVQIDLAAASPELAWELWISFASLLRSHVAMHAIARPSARLEFTSRADRELEIDGSLGTLRVTAPDATDRGDVFFIPGLHDTATEKFKFFFDADGLLHFDDSGMDLESAAEHLLRKVQA